MDRKPYSNRLSHLLEKVYRIEIKIEGEEAELASMQARSSLPWIVVSVERQLEKLYEKLSEANRRVREHRMFESEDREYTKLE